MQTYKIQNFTFQDGTKLPEIQLAYKEFNPSAEKTALVSTCFRGRIDTTLNFTDGALQGHRVIVVALLGNGESAAPSNTPDFPKSLDYRDCVRAQYEMLTKHLNVSSLDVVVGFSMGGQLAYHWVSMYPEFVKNAVVICSSARTSLHNYQFLEGPKAALENAVDYEDGAFRTKGAKALRGLHAFARAYSAWLTSAEWFDAHLYKQAGFDTLEAWGEAGDKGYDDWDPDDLLVMLRMWQKSDISHCFHHSEGEGTPLLPEALAKIEARVLLMPCKTDQYFRPDANERETIYLNKATLDIIPSVWGHIAGGGANKEDTEWMDERITRFLSAS